MDITTVSAPPSRISGIPSKSLDNPKRSKPSAEDHALADELDGHLQNVPVLADVTSADQFPLLAALLRHDNRAGTQLARDLVFVSARTHRFADERRVAEYLLRNRGDISSDHSSAVALLLAARCAAEMDVRRIRQIEIPSASPTKIYAAVDAGRDRPRDPSVGEVVLTFLHEVTGYVPPTDVARERLLNSVAIALELSERHALNGGAAPSVLAMRSDARPSARLATHLRSEFADDVAARSLARLLVGGQGTSMGTSLLWRVSRAASVQQPIPLAIRRRWLWALADADPAVRGTPAERRCRQRLPPNRRCQCGYLPDRRSDAGNRLGSGVPRRVGTTAGITDD